MRTPVVLMSATVLFFLLLAGIVAWLVNPGPLSRDAPRKLPWVLPDHRLAVKQVSYGPGGMIEVDVEHPLLRGISPEMVAWFYRQLPISTVAYRGTTYPLYHFFHPSEHGTIWVVEPASDGSSGMGQGAIVARNEWFGPYDSRGSARLVSFSASGMVAEASVAGIRFARIEHHFSAAQGGTRYRLQALIGSDLPLVGPLFNIYLRKRIYHRAMINEWLRHQVEEVSSLPFFLPQIYAQRNGERRHYEFRE